MVRTQLYLDARMHRRLRALADRQGRTVSDLVRDALVRAYGPTRADERLTTLDGMTGLWRDREDLGAADAYVRQMRRDTRRSRSKG
jgi:hypothetical protein